MNIENRKYSRKTDKFLRIVRIYIHPALSYPIYPAHNRFKMASKIVCPSCGKARKYHICENNLCMLCAWIKG